MSNLKVVVQLYDEKTGEYIGDADVRTTADLVFFADGQTFQQKLDNGTLRGAAGAKGRPRRTGSTWTGGSNRTDRANWSNGTKRRTRQGRK